MANVKLVITNIKIVGDGGTEYISDKTITICDRVFQTSKSGLKSKLFTSSKTLDKLIKCSSGSHNIKAYATVYLVGNIIKQDGSVGKSISSNSKTISKSITANVEAVYVPEPELTLTDAWIEEMQTSFQFFLSFFLVLNQTIIYIIYRNSFNSFLVFSISLLQARDIMQATFNSFLVFSVELGNI